MRSRERWRAGSEWIYLKLYAGPARLDELVLAAERQASAACREGHATHWFYIRYADPERHLRVRLHRAPDADPDDLARLALTWARELQAADLCDRFALDTYVKETDRYGGEQSMDLMEHVFAADSAAAARLVELDRARALPAERSLVAAVSADRMLAALGQDLSARLEQYEQAGVDPERDGALYRQHGRTLRLAFSDALDGDPAWATVRDTLQARTTAVSAICLKLRELEREGELEISYDSICAALAHMTFNRLLTPRELDEPSIMRLLARVTRGLLVSMQGVRT